MAGISASALAVICPPTHAPSNEGIILDLGTLGFNSALPVRSWGPGAGTESCSLETLGPVGVSTSHSVQAPTSFP